MITRREWVAGTMFAARKMAAMHRGVPLIESHLHLFAGDPVRFPYSDLAYKPEPLPLEQWVRFAQFANINRAVIVHPEPYQDDHTYLEYCFAHEPAPGFFKGTCLFDPIRPETPDRMRALIKRNPGRIVALRILEVHQPGTPFTTAGAIRDRDFRDPGMARVWRAADELGVAIQINCIPHYAPHIGALAAEFQGVPVILDHLGHLPPIQQGTPAEYDQVFRLADLPRVYMKFTGSGVKIASMQEYPHSDAKQIVKRVYETFGADRILWGELGDSMASFLKAAELLDTMFDFASESERAKIRGLTAERLFAFSTADSRK